MRYIGSGEGNSAQLVKSFDQNTIRFSPFPDPGRVAHNRLKTSHSKLIFQGDGQAVKRPHDLPGVLQNLVQFSCYFNSLVDEYLRQAVRQLLCDDCLLVERDDQFLSRELRRTKFGQELRYIVQGRA